jgi:dipicolinate synthase subunit A
MVTKCVNLGDAVRQSDFILLPLPYSLDGIHLNTPLSQSEIHFHDIFNQLEPDQTVLAGKINGNAKLISNCQQIKIIDYYEREDLTVLNALPTAEGAINIAMQEMPGMISNSKALILGYGRIGKLLAHKLYGLQAQIYISARKHVDLAWIEAFGYSGLSYGELDGYLDKFDTIFNTVPSLLLDEPRLKKIKQDCVIIDLASNPGGVDFNAAKNIGRNVIWALSLPGKYASASAGKILAKTIKIIMEEEFTGRGVLGAPIKKEEDSK